MQAVAQASIACQSTNAKHKCFELEASTTGFAKASMELHAQAVANAAVEVCGCDKGTVSAWASGYAETSVYHKLIASATANVAIEVCVEGMWTNAVSLTCLHDLNDAEQHHSTVFSNPCCTNFASCQKMHNIQQEILCVAGDGTFVDSAYDSCTEYVTAELFARVRHQKLGVLVSYAESCALSYAPSHD